MWCLILTDNGEGTVDYVRLSDCPVNLLKRASGVIAVHDMTDRSIGDIVASLKAYGTYNLGLKTLHLKEGELV